MNIKTIRLYLYIIVNPFCSTLLSPKGHRCVKPAAIQKGFGIFVVNILETQPA